MNASKINHQKAGLVILNGFKEVYRENSNTSHTDFHVFTHMHMQTASNFFPEGPLELFFRKEGSGIFGWRKGPLIF